MSDKLPVRPHHINKTEKVEFHRDSGVSRGLCESRRESPVLPVESTEPVEETVSGNIDGGDCVKLSADVQEQAAHNATLPTYQPTNSEYDEHCVTQYP